MKLVKSLINILNYNSISLDDITNLDDNCGCIWFNANGKGYYISVNECAEEVV